MLKGARGQSLKLKPVNNARADKLDNFMWRNSFAERRCLIPVTEFAEAEGERHAKNRTWFALLDQDVFAVAGLWRDTAEWGPGYPMVMTGACLHVTVAHDRMPVILRRDDWADWLTVPPTGQTSCAAPIRTLWLSTRLISHGAAREFFRTGQQ